MLERAFLYKSPKQTGKSYYVSIATFLAS